MAIQTRRGNKVNFDKDKTLPGELVTVLDTQEAFICFGAGITKKMATDEDYADMIEESITATENAKKATVNANTAVADFRALEVSKLAINDSVKSTVSGWSSNKIGNEIDTAKATLNTSLANQIGTANGSSINLHNSFNGGLFLKELQGKSVQNGIPTPEAKADIVSVGDDGSVVVKTCGKNLLSMADKSTQLISGITFTQNRDGSITLNGTATADSDCYFWGTWSSSTPKFILKSGTYTLKGVSSNPNITLYLVHAGSIITSIIGASSKTFNLSSDTSVSSCFIRVSKGTILNNLVVYPQLELGTTSTTYEPYKEQLVTIPLTQPLRSVGSVYDRGCVKVNGVWGNERKFLQLDNSKIVIATTSNGAGRRIRIVESRVKLKGKILCSHFQSADDKSSYYISGDYITVDENTFVNIRCDSLSSLITDNASAISWANTNGLKIWAELATPIFEPYSQALQDTLNKLQTYQGVTNVFTTDALQPNMIVEYGKTDTSALSLYANNIYDSKVDKSKVTKSLAVTESGFIADAEAIKTINDKADANTKAIGEVNNNLQQVTYQGSDMTHVAGATVGLVFTKYNFGLVTVKGYIMLATAITSQEAAITLPIELRPSSSVCTSAYVGVGGDFTNMQAFILADGKLNLYASASKDLYYINTAYSV